MTLLTLIVLLFTYCNALPSYTTGCNDGFSVDQRCGLARNLATKLPKTLYV